MLPWKCRDMSSDPEYHLRELAVARSSNDPRRAVPDIPQGAKRVLDIGCGAGQTLVAADLKGAKAFGIDFEHSALKLGKQISPGFEFARASGEALPFRAASFDFVFSRVALPYMKIAYAATEMERVLRPGGEIWITLHPLSMLSWRNAFSHPKRLLFEVYRLVNTALLHFTGKQFRYPLRRNRTESYQTSQGIRRVLKRAGFQNIQVIRQHHFLVTAQKAKAQA